VTTPFEETEKLRAEVDAHEGELGDLRASLSAAEAEVDRLRAKLDMPCGSCHPCLNWPAETWKRAGRHLPDVHRFGEMEDERTQLRADVDALLPAAKLCLATLDADAPMNPAEALLVTTVRDVIARHGGSR
jgi:hypothetical protein